MKVSGKVTFEVPVEVPVYRRWWQFWLPRIVGSRTERYRIVSHTGDCYWWPVREI